jgi:hypothetical protein
VDVARLNVCLGVESSGLFPLSLLMTRTPSFRRACHSVECAVGVNLTIRTTPTC